MRRGFTVVELLIVIVVIGILATLTIISYNGVQSQARAASQQSDLNQSQKALEKYKLTNSETFPGNLASAVSAAGLKTSADNSYNYTAYTTAKGPNTGFCLQSTNAISGGVFYVTAQGTTKSGTCETITNYVRDPDAASATSNFSTVGNSPATTTDSIASDRAHRGSTSYKRVVTVAGQLAAIAYIPSGMFVANSGETVQWSAWVYSTVSGNLSPYMEGSRVSDAAYWGQGGGTTVFVPANTWTQVTGTAVMNTTANILRVGAYNLSAGVGDIMWSDEYFATKTTRSAPVYADGNSPNWIWIGSPNASSSTGPAL